MVAHPLDNVLFAHAPDAVLANELALFGQFVGVWDVDVTWFAEGAEVRRATGEWRFGWTLQGRAIQDVWMVPGPGENDDQDRYEYGTSIRFFDRAISAWRSTWIGPVQGIVRTFIAQERDDEIVLHGQLPNRQSVEWIFSDIEADRFCWRFQVAKERSWEVVQSFTCIRRKGPF